ncbi:MAG: DUF2279 domain-containing protein [Burkholderiales bacterium]
MFITLVERIGALRLRVKVLRVSSCALLWLSLLSAAGFVHAEPTPSPGSEEQILPAAADDLRLLLSTSLADAPVEAERSAATLREKEISRRTTLFLAGSALAVGTYGALKWWNEGLSSDFRTVSEGWFGRNTPKGGADKLGHAFGTYTGVRVGSHVLELIGNSPDRALKLATAASLTVYTLVEILDGFTDPYRFSKEDMIANFVGAGFGWVMQRNPRLDALLDFRLYYRQSPEAKAEGKWAPFDDYNGQRYLLALKGAGVAPIAHHPLLRYTELVVGYGVRGYDPPGAEKSRHLYAGVGVNLSQLLDDTVFKNRRDSLLRKETALFLELFQIPNTAVTGQHGL